MKTVACEMLGCDVPIVAFTHCRDVVAAVTKAGGFGVLGAAAHSPDELDTDMKWIHDEVGGRPFGVDIIVPARYEGKAGGRGAGAGGAGSGGASAAVGAEARAAVGGADGELSAGELRAMIPPQHRAFVDDLLERYDVPPLPAEPDAPGLWSGPSAGGAPAAEAPMTYSQAQPLLDVAFSYPIRLAVNALGPPPPDMVTRAHDADVLVGALAGKKAHAERHAAAGVDIVIAQGYEAGGHTGEVATMVLVPEVVDAVAPLPVLAAGGISNGRQVAAALALGAQGVWCGSVWLTTLEAETHPAVKQKFLAATSSDTVRSRSHTGKPARQLRSAWTDEWDGPDSPGPLPMPLQPMLVAAANRRIERAAANPANEGAVALANYFVGQVVGQLDESVSASRVVTEMIDEYLDVMERFDHLNA